MGKDRRTQLAWRRCHLKRLASPLVLRILFLLSSPPRLASSPPNLDTSTRVAMSSGSLDQKREAPDTAPVHVQDLEEKNTLQSEILVNPELMNDAFGGENREHQMGMWAAVKTHPKACFWAFIMSFTIVSPVVHAMAQDLRRDRRAETNSRVSSRSWNRSTCS